MSSSAKQTAPHEVPSGARLVLYACPRRSVRPPTTAWPAHSGMSPMPAGRRSMTHVGRAAQRTVRIIPTEEELQ